MSLNENLNEKIIKYDPRDKFDNVRHVYRFGSQRVFCQDLYRVKEHGGVLIRQDYGAGTVKWLTALEWAEGYEADSPVKDGLTFIAIDKNGAELFIEETYRTKWDGGGQADKKYPFSWEEEE